MKKEYNTPVQRERRKFFREVGAMADDMLRAMGFTPAERRTQMAISLRLYEYANEAPDKPRQVSLLNIGKGLTSRSDDDEACKQQAIRHVGHLLNHAIPRTGYQTHTRYKAEEGSNKAHEYVDHIVPVASFFGELLAEEVSRILSNKDIDRKAKAEKIAESRARLIEEALTYSPKCEVELIQPDGVSYAYVSGPEAKEYCRKNPDFKAKAFEYSEPEPDVEKPKKPYCGEDFTRLIRRAVNQAVDQVLDDVGGRNGKDTARVFWIKELLPAIEHAGEKWINYCRVEDEYEYEEEEEEEELYTGDKSDMGTDADDLTPEPVLPVENSSADETEPGDKLSPGQGAKSFADNTDENDTSETDPVENFSEPEPEQVSDSENFDSSLEAAISYVRDGWAVVPICQFDPATGRCTGPDSHHEDGICKGKVPLVAAKDSKPGQGYQAASRDKGLVTDWFTRLFPRAGVGFRLDNCIIGDCILFDPDAKNGGRGIESYAELSDTFDISATLNAVTPSLGAHHIFTLPDGLPADYLGNWTRVLDSVGLPDIDIKVGVKGLAFEEPTMGASGRRYRWVDPTAEIAELPRAVCDFIHEVHEREQQAKLEKSKASASAHSASSDAQPFDPADDQAKYFKDAPNGGRRPRLRSIACCLAAGGANEEQIVTVLKYHDGHFTEPTNDAKFIARVAHGAVSKYAPGVAAQ